MLTVVLPQARTFAFPPTAIEMTSMTYCKGLDPVVTAPTCPPPLDAAGSAIVSYGNTGKQAYYTIVRNGSSLRAVFLELVAAPLPSGALASSSASATPAPTTLGGMPVVPVDPAGLLTVDVPDSPARQEGNAPTGPYVYLLTGGGNHGLVVADIGGGSERPVAVDLAPQEGISQALLDRSWIALMIWRHTGAAPTDPGVPCSGNEGQPIAWRIVVAHLGADGLPDTPWRQIDTGIARRAFRPPLAGEYCDGPQVPNLAFAGGRLAYGVEAATAARPGASRILVRDDSGGAPIDVVDVASQVLLVQLSLAAVAWSESANELLGATTPSWQIMEAPLDQTASPREVPLGSNATPAENFPPLFLLDGSSVIASIDEFAGASGQVVRVTGTRIEAIDPGTAGVDCGAWSIVANVLVLGCQDQDGRLWTAIQSGTGSMAALEVRGSTDLSPIAFDGQWLVVAQYDYQRQQSMFEAIPTGSLAMLSAASDALPLATGSAPPGTNDGQNDVPCPGATPCGP
jgi:hypothetical protein